MSNLANNSLQRLLMHPPHEPMTLIGLMSGTSVDGIDACCAQFSMVAEQFHYKIIGQSRINMPLNLKERLLEAMTGHPLLLSELGQLDMEIGELFAEAVLTLLASYGLSPHDIHGIGSHGQTIFHQPPSGSRQGYTLQIGNPCIIAERTGICTVADFRPRDMAAGGQGAPLVPYADRLLFQDTEKGRCIQNIGGIGNVTVIPAASSGLEVFGFDTGPGNMLIDAATMHFYAQPFDRSGSIAASGQVYAPLLTQLMKHEFLQLSPPKSTGREIFGIPFLHSMLAQFPHLSKADWIATLTEFTACSIVDAYEKFIFPKIPICEVVIGGGGTYNHTLLNRLTVLLNQGNRKITLLTHEDFNIPNQSKEALAFGILAWTTLMGFCNNVPMCTGATHPVILGKIIPGAP